MQFLSSLTFVTPLALTALLLLPVIWWLLRFTPPRPQTVAFPPLRLLLGLANREEQPDKTPWWLMLLRLLIAALVIIGVSHPLYAPGRVAALSNEPLLLVIDDSWAAAKDWNKRQSIIAEILEKAKAEGATVTLATTVPELRNASLEPSDAAAAADRAAAMRPKALEPDRLSLLDRLKTSFASATALRVIWLSDGFDDGKAKDFAEGLASLANGAANVEAIVPDAASLPPALLAPEVEGGRIKVTAWRATDQTTADAMVTARAGNGRSLGEVKLSFAPQEKRASASFELPIELRNDMQRLEINNERNAAATYLFDDRWRRKTVALQSGAAFETAQPLLSPLYYVSRALEPFAELTEPGDTAALKRALDSGLSMLVLADIGVIPEENQRLIEDWVKNGGMLLRFAGPRLAGATPEQDDPLLPARLREGGRSLGSALSWETPQSLQDFPAKSPFAGLTIDPSITVSRQVLAEPDADLPDRVWASLADGTPLVTARQEGKGFVVLFHVTANADWSNLPLAGIFVEMLRRLIDLAPAAGSGTASAANAPADAQAYMPYRALDGFGDLVAPQAETRPLAASAIDKAIASPATPAGLYRKGAMERAINLSVKTDALQPIGELPANVARRDLSPLPVQPLAPLAFAAAFILFLLDCLASLFLGGGFQKLRQRGAVACLLFLALVPMGDAKADPAEDYALNVGLDTHLAYVKTGDAEIDRVSEQGLRGLSQILRDRTSVEPGDPVAVDIERDEIVFFPLLYWPVRANAPALSDAAIARMDTYMKNGGTIFFDLREDGASAGELAGGTSPAGQTLRTLLAKLDIPALEPVPTEHVLTKSFYLLDSFPGRYDLGPLWVERSDEGAGSATNADGVSSIIIGSNDYAGAWALSDGGNPLYAVMPGGDLQREMAFRVGINIVMYALTGNYKADQVHVPALLERLGQ